MIVLNDLHPVGKAAGGRELHLVLRLVRPIPAPLFRLPEYRGRQGSLPGQLRHVVLNAVLINEGLLRKGAVLCLVPEMEGNALVHHGLTPQHILEIL